MSKQLFNDAGVTSKIQELYKLPEHILRAETESIRVDFRSWMRRHFDLTEKQILFLEKMEYPAIQILAEELADCFLFQLPFFIIWPPLNPIGSKFILPNSSLMRIVQPDGNYVITGQLVIEIIYK